MSLQKINGVENFKKDSETKAVLSVDNRGLEAYKAQKRNRMEVIEDINSIKAELRELKGMLRQLIASRD